MLGYEPDRGKVSTARLLAAALALLALCSVIPAAIDAAEHFRAGASPGLARWAYLLMLVGAVQLAYAVYLVQLPDWSTVRVVALLSLVLATSYATLLGLTLLSRDDSPLVRFLELTDHLQGGRVTGWCFIMLCVASLLSYLSGRISGRWRQAVVRG